ncbi:MAG: DUF2007 domain-containing protein [Alphaproteobacteria bacterium]
MVELFRSNDPVLLSYVQALLKDAGIEAVLLDGHTSVLEGSINAIQRRLMVLRDDEAAAKQVLREADLGVGQT